MEARRGFDEYVRTGRLVQVGQDTHRKPLYKLAEYLDSASAPGDRDGLKRHVLPGFRFRQARIARYRYYAPRRCPCMSLESGTRSRAPAGETRALGTSILDLTLKLCFEDPIIHETGVTRYRVIEHVQTCMWSD